MIKVKNLYKVLLVIMMLVTINADAKDLSSNKKKVQESAEANIMLNRLNELKEMDKSGLNHAEKKAIRQEVKALKTDLAALGGGVYLSAGAIIIILLILILVL